MICFRCFLNIVDNKNTFIYSSFWIVNTNDDFELKEVIDLETFYKDMRKLDPETNNLVGEGYVH